MNDPDLGPESNPNYDPDIGPEPNPKNDPDLGPEPNPSKILSLDLNPEYNMYDPDLGPKPAIPCMILTLNLGLNLIKSMTITWT